MEFRLKKNKRGNFFMMGNIFIDEYASTLGSSAICVYLCLKRYMNRETRIAFPSEKLIAKQIDMNPRSVIRAIKKLEKFGFISKQKIRQNGQYFHNVYFLNLSKDWLKLGDKNELTQVTNTSNLDDKNNKNYVTLSHLNNTNNNNNKEQKFFSKEKIDFKKYKPNFIKELEEVQTT